MPALQTASLRAHASMLLWTLVVGSSFPLVATLTPGLPLLLLTALRFAIALLALLPFLPAGALSWPGVKSLLLYLALGLCLAMFFGTMFWAAARTSALSMAAIYVSVPLLAYGGSILLGLDVLARVRLQALLLGAIGALLLAWAGASDGTSASGSSLGGLVFLGGCAATALYAVLTKWGLATGWLPSNAVTRTAWSLLAGGSALAIAGLASEAPADLLNLQASDLAVVLYLGVFSTGLTFWLTQTATAALRPVEVQGYSYLVPLIPIFVQLLQAPAQVGALWLPGALLVALALWWLSGPGPAPAAAG